MRLERRSRFRPRLPHFLRSPHPAPGSILRITPAGTTYFEDSNRTFTVASAASGITGNLTLTLTFPAHGNKTDILYIVRRADTPSMAAAQDAGYFTAGN